MRCRPSRSRRYARRLPYAPRRGTCIEEDLGRGHPCLGARRRGPEGTQPAWPSGAIAPGSWRADEPAVAPGRAALGSSHSRRDGLETSPVGVRDLHPRRPPQRPGSGRGGRRGGAAAFERRGVGQVPTVVAPPGELHVPGSSARTVGRPGVGPRRLVGVVGPGGIASPALAFVGHHTRLGVGSHGSTDEGVFGLARGGAAGWRGGSWGLACEQPGGMRPQRGADAAGTAPDDDAGITGPETPVLEPASLSSWPPPRSDAVRPAGPGTARAELLGVPQADTGGIAGTTVRAGGCGVRWCLLRRRCVLRTSWKEKSLRKFRITG